MGAYLPVGIPVTIPAPLGLRYAVWTVGLMGVHSDEHCWAALRGETLIASGDAPTFAGAVAAGDAACAAAAGPGERWSGAASREAAAARAGQDPIAKLLRDLREHGKPSLAWVTEWSRGDADPVRAAWDMSANGAAMFALLAANVGMFSRAGIRLAHAVVAAGESVTNTAGRWTLVSYHEHGPSLVAAVRPLGSFLPSLADLLAPHDCAHAPCPHPGEVPPFDTRADAANEAMERVCGAFGDAVTTAMACGDTFAEAIRNTIELVCDTPRIRDMLKARSEAAGEVATQFGLDMNTILKCACCGVSIPSLAGIDGAPPGLPPLWSRRSDGELACSDRCRKTLAGRAAIALAT